MTTPDRQQILDAWETIDWLKSLINPDSDTIQGDTNRMVHAIQDLAEALPERPVQTMAELGWDGQYFLAEAEILGGYGDEVVMLYGRNPGDTVTAIVTNVGVFDPCQLAPTGRRCKLVLDDGHPEYLETEQDYEDAPEGTVSELRPGGLPLIKHGSIWKSCTWAGSGEKMSGERRRVLRWGRGDDA